MMTMIIMIMSMTQNARIVDIMKEQTTAKCPVITNAEVSMEATIMMETFQVTVSWVITLIIQDSTPFMQTYTSKPTIICFCIKVMTTFISYCQRGTTL